MKQTLTKPEPILEDPLDCWPPEAHFIRKEDEPVKEGTIALCGKKLMGINLQNMDAGKICAKCVEILKRECS